MALDEARQDPETGRFKVGNPSGQGKKKGSHNSITNEHKAFCREILFSEEYRQSIKRRIREDTLAPAVEALIHYYAVGKPADRVKVQHHIAGVEQYKQLTDEQIAEREKEFAEEIQAKRLALAPAPAPQDEMTLDEIERREKTEA